MIDGKIITSKTTPSYSGSYTSLGDIIESKAPDEFYLDPDDEAK